ncbi:GNAT family N-acetyltransferase [Nanoarchaeota archaeon]
MIIRKAKIKDLNQICILAKDFDVTVNSYAPKEFKFMRQKNRPVNKNLKEILLKDMRKRNSLLLVAEEDNILKGYIYGSVNKKQKLLLFKFIKIGLIEDLAVKKEFRNKGIASILYKELIKWFKNQKCKVIELQVLKQNPALNIYHHWGFHESLIKMRKLL